MRDLGIRPRLEKKEDELSPWAARSASTRGRAKPEEPCPLRTAFQRDRDRIIHSKAFRRLKHKTQVFIAPLGDHYVTRLTHTLEVSQIARTIARALNLNEDLTEAIALGHDLGHTPFGHVGEEVLNELHPGGFRHNEQSLRVVDFLEKDGVGLNLTWEVRDGILNHSKTRAEVLGEEWGPVGTLEGQVCKIADLVAYINHDVVDAIRASLILESDLPEKAVATLGQSSSERIDRLVSDIVEHSWAATGEGYCLGDGKPSIGMSPSTQKAAEELRHFLFERVYTPSLSREETIRAREVLRSLYFYFLSHQDALPQEYCGKNKNGDVGVVDYVAGMTDLYALRLARELSLPISSS